MQQLTAFRFDPAHPDFIEDPDRTYRTRGDEEPAYFDEKTNCWLVSRDEDVARILDETATFSSAKGNAIIDSPLRVGKTLGSMDPPRHDELRRVVMRGVTPARIEAMLPPLRDHVRRVLGELSGRRACDLVADIGRPILYGALGRMLGLDGAGADKAAELSKSLFHAGLGPTGSPLTPDGFRAVFEFLGEQVAKRSADRGDDIISVLLNAKDAGAPTSDQEIVANMTTVLLAGNASIGHYFTNLMYALCFPDERELIGPQGSTTRSGERALGYIDAVFRATDDPRRTIADTSFRGFAAGGPLCVSQSRRARDLEPDISVGRAKVRHTGSARGRIFASQTARHAPA